MLTRQEIFEFAAHRERDPFVKDDRSLSECLAGEIEERNREFTETLQRVYDKYPPETWSGELQFFTADYDLGIPEALILTPEALAFSRALRELRAAWLA